MSTYRIKGIVPESNNEIEVDMIARSEDEAVQLAHLQGIDVHGVSDLHQVPTLNDTGEAALVFNEMELLDTQAEGFFTSILRMIPDNISRLINSNPDDDYIRMWDNNEEREYEKSPSRRNNGNSNLVNSLDFGSTNYMEFDDSQNYLADAKLTLSRELESGSADEISNAAEEFLVALSSVTNSSILQDVISVSSDVLANWAFFLDDASELDADPLSSVKAAIVECCNRLCELIANNPSTIDQIEWRDLERAVATALTGIGFRVTLTPPSKDGGKDVIVECVLKGRIHTYYLEIKHWKSGKRVGHPVVSQFVEVITKDKVDGGIILSTSGYSNEVFAAVGQIDSKLVRIRGSDTIVAMCQMYTRERNRLWLKKEPLPQLLYAKSLDDV